jgi:tripartite-type tricarboxylate transporter receptor subunit TctC
LQLIQDGKLRAFGVSTDKRVKTAPEIPTIAEAGLPGYFAQGWFAVVAPAGTPRPIVDKLNAVLTSHINKPEVQDRLYAVGIQPLTSTPDELAKFIPAEIEKWGQVIRDAGIPMQ